MFAHKSLELVATIAGLPPVHVLPSQIIPDDLFVRSKENAASLFIRQFFVSSWPIPY
jgi:hypothetical protein